MVRMQARKVAARENDYSNVGKTGRRTGITLKERQRDEHGFEIIDGSMFESPVKSSPKRNGVSTRGGDKGPSSESMQIDESSIPEPTELLSTRKILRSSDRPILPPPRARSPIKTSLGSSPRRTPNIRSSPGRTVEDETPSRPSLTGTGPKRLLDFSQTTLSATTHSPQTRAQSAKKPLVNGSYLQTQDVIADFSDADSMELVDEVEDVLVGNVTTGDPGETDPGDSFTNVLGDDLSDPQMEHFDPELGNDLPVASIEYQAEEEEEDAEAGVEDSEDDDDEFQAEEETAEEAPESSPPKPLKAAKKKNSPKTNGIESASLGQGSSEKKGRKRGRPKANQTTTVYQDPEEENPRPMKKPKPGKRVPKPKDANAKMMDHPKIEEMIEKVGSRPRPPRNLYILRRETPTDDSVVHTRSGRVSVRPLAYWKNERCIFGDGEAKEGERFPLATIKEIIRADEVELTPAQKRSRARRRAKGRASEDSEAEDDAEKDDWEIEPGMISGDVHKWDSDIQEAVDEIEQLDLAYAGDAIETRGVRKATFQYAKIISTPFFGAGIVDLPAGAVKNRKNSRKMHMAFFVATGRVVVEVNGTRFGLGKGGVWQVPRGNSYSIFNETERPARVFFSQGCEPIADSGDLNQE